MQQDITDLYRHKSIKAADELISERMEHRAAHRESGMTNVAASERIRCNLPLQKNCARFELSSAGGGGNPAGEAAIRSTWRTEGLSCSRVNTAPTSRDAVWRENGEFARYARGNYERVMSG